MTVFDGMIRVLVFMSFLIVFWMFVAMLGSMNMIVYSGPRKRDSLLSTLTYCLVFGVHYNSARTAIAKRNS